MIEDGTYEIVNGEGLCILSVPVGTWFIFREGRIKSPESMLGYLIPSDALKNGYIKLVEKTMTEKTIAERTRDALIEKMKSEHAPDWNIKGTSLGSFAEPEAEPEVEVEVEYVGVECGEGQVLYSELFDRSPLKIKGGDFAITCYKDEDWDEEDRVFIPDMAEFDTFVIDHDVLTMEMRALEHDLKVLVVGPSGSGKTSLQKFICAKTRQPYLRINGRQDMESDTLLGKPWVKAGAMEFVLGELPKALQKGWFIAFDEPWKTPAGIQMSLQRMYERGGILQLDDMPGSLADKQIVPKNTFKMVLCDNVVGTGDNSAKYGATMIQDGSTLNRIDVVLNLGYLSFDDEVSMILGMHPKLGSRQASQMVSLGNLLRTGYEQDELSAALSPRNLDAWGMLTVATGSIRMAFEMTILGRYAEDDELAAVEEHYRNVFG